MKRYFPIFSKTAQAWIIADSTHKVKANDCGFAVLWGTDNPDKKIVQKECDKMNKDPKYYPTISVKK